MMNESFLQISTPAAQVGGGPEGVLSRGGAGGIRLGEEGCGVLGCRVLSGSVGLVGGDGWGIGDGGAFGGSWGGGRGFGVPNILWEQWGASPLGSGFSGFCMQGVLQSSTFCMQQVCRASGSVCNRLCMHWVCMQQVCRASGSACVGSACIGFAEHQAVHALGSARTASPAPRGAAPSHLPSSQPQPPPQIATPSHQAALRDERDVAAALPGPPGQDLLPAGLHAPLHRPPRAQQRPEPGAQQPPRLHRLLPAADGQGGTGGGHRLLCTPLLRPARPALHTHPTFCSCSPALLHAARISLLTNWSFLLRLLLLQPCFVCMHRFSCTL